MDNFDWVNVLAILLGPILAVQAQSFIENKREKKQRKLEILKTLIATKSQPQMYEHVRALNLINIEFYGNKKVISAWEKYYNFLSNGKTETIEWHNEREDLLTKLLSEILEATRFKFNKSQLATYTPKAFFDTEISNNILKEKLKTVLSGETAIHMSVDSFPSAPQEILQNQNKLQKSLIDCLDGEKPIRIKIDN